MNAKERLLLYSNQQKLDWFVENTREWLPTVLDGIAISATGGALLIFCLFVFVLWRIARSSKDEHMSIWTIILLPGLVAGMPLMFAGCAFGLRLLYEHAFLDKGDGMVGRTARDAVGEHGITAVYIVVGIPLVLAGFWVFEKAVDFVESQWKKLSHRRRTRIERITSDREGRFREGFKRLAVVAGGLFALPGLLIGFSVLWASGGVAGLLFGFGVGLVASAILFCLGWSPVKLIGWVVAGFVFSRLEGPNENHQE